MSVRIDSQGLMAQLKNELVIDYDVTKDEDDIVADFIALQVSTYPITTGTIDFSASRTMTIDSDNLYDAIMRMQEVAGGYVLVDINRALHWLSTIAVDVGKQIRYRKNLVGITRSIDYTVANRIYGFGEAITLAAPGYVEDAASQMANGYVAISLTDKSISNVPTLTAYATNQLALRKDPKITYAVSVAGDDDYDLGNVVTIIDEDLGINVKAQVVRITRYLESNQVQIELAAVLHDITSQIGRDYRWRREFY
jgi:phage minor structural protein